ncbi:MAG: sensor histidine kinase [Desulfobulbus sp.]|jgi:two-component system NtrC family sensor kinase
MMQPIKLRLGLALLVFTVFCTAATHGLVSLFWLGDRLASETARLRELLARTAADSAAPADATPLPQPLADWLEAAPGRCALWQGAGYPAVAAEGCVERLQAAAQRAEQTGSEQRSSFFSVLHRGSLVLVRPDGAGLSLPSAQALAPLWARQKVIGTYLLFNACLFAGLFFVRQLKTYVLPIDRMVRAAESYRSDDALLPDFIAAAPASELGRLSTSIQAMLRRIETDRVRLHEAVQEQTRANRLLCENQREMIHAEKLASVGRLAAGLAHEIGNPLGVVQGYVQLLAMETDAAERAEYADRALSELGRVDALIRQLLSHARSEGTTGAQCFLLGELLTDMVAGLRDQPFFAGIALETACAAAEDRVWVDPNRLRQVVLNCLLNAVDAVSSCREQGQGRIVLSTQEALEPSAEGERPMVLLRIADNGAGLAPGVEEAAFDPFFTTREPGKGTGLGLWVSASLIESMGGRIRLHGGEGGGAVVDIVLPLAEDPACAPEKEQENAQSFDY